MIFTKNYKELLKGFEAGANGEKLKVLKLTTIENSDGDDFDLFSTEYSAQNAFLASLMRTYVAPLSNQDIRKTPALTGWPTGMPYISGGDAFRFAIGSGSTPESENDTNLEAMILNQSFTTARNHYEQVSNGSLTRTTKVVLTNTSGQILSFQELGVLLGQNLSSLTPTYNTDVTGSLANARIPFLLTRHVFDSPISVPIGESVTLAFSFRKTLGTSTDYPDTPLSSGWSSN